MANRYHYCYPLALLSLLLQTGCGDSGAPTAATPPAATPPAAAPATGQVGAGATPTASAGAPLASRVPAAPSALSAPPPPDPSFTPLPSPEQVKRAQPIGQLDPFRPLAQEIQDLVVKSKAKGGGAAAAMALSASSAMPPRLELPPGWQISGLIGGAGPPEAVVSFQGASGTVRVGDVGSAVGRVNNATNLLPDGWRVAAIHLNRGAIVLEFKGQTMTKQI